MAVKIADTLKALSNTFPVAECIDIDVNINGETKRLQKAIDDGEIGGSDSSWKGTKEEWEALSTEEKGKYEVVCFTNDYDDAGLIDNINISTQTTYSSAKIEEKFNVVDDGLNDKLSIQQSTANSGKVLKVGNDGNIEFVDGGSDLLWKGTKEEWEALSTEEKGKYEIVCFTND